MTPNERIVQLVKSYIGAGIAEDKQRYLDLIGPNEDAATLASMATMSGCALSVRGFWRLLGVDHPILSSKYRIGKAVSDVLSIANHFGAVYPSVVLPKPGDVVIVGGGNDGGGSEHVFTITSAPEEFGDDGKARLESVDGGQKDEHGLQCIKQKYRVWQKVNGQIWDTSSADSASDSKAKGRKVQYVIDCSKLGIVADELTPAEI